MNGQSFARSIHPTAPMTPDTVRVMAQRAVRVIETNPCRFVAAATWFSNVSVRETRGIAGTELPIATRLNAAWLEVRKSFERLEVGEYFARMSEDAATRLCLLCALLFEPEFDGSLVGLPPMVWEQLDEEGAPLDSRYYYSAGMEPFADGQQGDRCDWSLHHAALAYLENKRNKSPTREAIVSSLVPWQHAHVLLEQIAAGLAGGRAASEDELARLVATAISLFPGGPRRRLPPGVLADRDQSPTQCCERLADFLKRAAKAARVGKIDSALAEEAQSVRDWIERCVRPVLREHWVILPPPESSERAEVTLSFAQLVDRAIAIIERAEVLREQAETVAQEAIGLGMSEQLRANPSAILGVNHFAALKLQFDQLARPLVQIAYTYEIDGGPLDNFIRTGDPSLVPGAITVLRRVQAVGHRRALALMESGQATAPPPAVSFAAQAHVTVSTKAIELLTKNPTFADATAAEWAERLGCAESTVRNTTAWKRRGQSRKLKTVTLTEDLIENLDQSGHIGRSIGARAQETELDRLVAEQGKDEAEDLRRERSRKSTRSARKR